MLADFLRFWRGPRPAMRALLDARPSEGRLLGFAALAVLILTIGRAVAASRVPVVATGLDDRQFELMTAEIFAAALKLPAFYLLAAIGTALARLFGGQGGWRDGRAAFFLAAFATAPLQAVLAALPGLVVLSPPVAVVLTRLGPVVFAWALAHCFAEAFGFRRTWAVFAVLAALILIPVALIWAVRS